MLYYLYIFIFPHYKEWYDTHFKTISQLIFFYFSTSMTLCIIIEWTLVILGNSIYVKIITWVVSLSGIGVYIQVNKYKIVSTLDSYLLICLSIKLCLTLIANMNNIPFKIIFVWIWRLKYINIYIHIYIYIPNMIAHNYPSI